jgi:hypothetical protein
MNECLICKEAITNPICIECVEKQVKVWLYETNPGLVGEVEREIDEINIVFGDTSCILCKNKMSVCSYCYTQHLLTWLENYPELIPEFKRNFVLNFFN